VELGQLFNYLYILNHRKNGNAPIWNRVSKLAESLGLVYSQIHELIDFYHAVEHLGSVAKLRKNWNASTRMGKKTAWVAIERGSRKGH